MRYHRESPHRRLGIMPICRVLFARPAAQRKVRWQPLESASRRCCCRDGGREKALASQRSQDVRGGPAQRSACGLAHLGKGVASPPVASPGPGPSARGPDEGRFTPSTLDQAALRPPATRPLFRQRPRPGEPSCPPWTSRPGVTSLSPWTPIDQACAAMDLHQGFAPVDLAGASVPLDPGQGGPPLHP